jgi:hypothetical protein
MRDRLARRLAYSECVSLALFVEHAMRTHHTILSSVACPALPYFPTLSHKQHNFLGGGGGIQIKMCFDFLCHFCPKYFSF